ncbi:MAG: T9SS type A sorting domain-containing protein, partial [Saprospiraceae bacterium]|nr:T9SS type A sorting domain-containing protein [Saprospiraceae bacterium]
IQRNTISGNQVGIVVYGIGYNSEELTCRIINNKIGINETGSSLGNSTGIEILQIDGPINIRDNQISYNDENGINVSHGRNLKISGNRIGTDGLALLQQGNGQNGIYLRNCWGTVNENIISGNIMHGILIDRGKVEVACNTIGGFNFGNGAEGISLRQGNHTVRENIVKNNQIGISVDSAKVTLYGNSVIANDLGLLFTYASSDYFTIESKNSLIGNKICENTVGIRGESYDLDLSLNDICKNNGNNSGLHLTNSKATITTNNFVSDAGDAIFLDPNSTAFISRNNFVDNQGLAINNQNTSLSVPAADNWFGDTSGPSGAGPGISDGVSTHVDFQNWRMEPVSVVGATLGDTIYVPAGDTITIPVYGQNWMDRDDQLNFSLSEEQDWSVFNPDQLTFLFIEDSLALQFPHEFIIPENPAVPENKVIVVVRSLNMPQQRDTVTFLLIAQERQLTNILVSPDSSFVEPGDTIDFFHTGLDQFGEVHAFQPNWNAEGGTIDSNGLYIAGDGGGTFIVTLSGGNVSSQAVVVIDAGATTNTESQSTPNGSDLALYPNPFHDQVTISYDIPRHHQVRMALFDLYGNLVYSRKELRPPGPQEVLCQMNALKENGLPAGIYFFQVSLEDKIYAGKIIRQ